MAKSKTLFIVLLISILKGYSQSSTLLPNAIELPKFSSNPTCNNSEKGRLIFNTTDNKSYYCNGTTWVDMSAGSLTLPYSGSASSGAGSPLIYVENTGNGRAIHGKSLNSIAIFAESTNSFGVYGSSISDYGVSGYSTTSIGVYAESQLGYGIYSYSSGSEFSAFLSGRARVSSRLAIGNLIYSQVASRLHIKGENTGGWGQHIRLENSTDTGYGEILHDGDGFKLRNFQAGDNFIFRNSLNNTTASINDTGELEVEGGFGIVRSANSTQLKTVLYQSPENINFTLNPGGSVVVNIAFSAFSATPTLSVGQWSSGVSGERHLLVVVESINTNSATLRVNNVGSAQATGTNASIRAIIIGPK